MTVKGDWFKKQPQNQTPIESGSGRGRRASRKSQHTEVKPPSAPLFVPRTPGGRLISLLKQQEENLNRFSSQRIKLTEEGGTTLEKLLIIPEPNKPVECIRSQCQVCRFPDNKGGCDRRSVCYVRTCLECESNGEPHKYWGETSSSLFVRSGQHISEGEKCLPTSHIWQHILFKHPQGIHSIRDNFKFQMVEHHSSAFTRQISECLLIKNSPHPVMNNKMMYSRCIIPEIGEENKWKTEESEESLRLKRLQKKLTREAKKKEKLKEREMYVSRSGIKEKKKRTKKACEEKMISFKRVRESGESRKSYEKIVKDKNKFMSNEAIMRSLRESCLIWNHFITTTKNCTEESNERKDRKRKREVRKYTYGKPGREYFDVTHSRIPNSSSKIIHNKLAESESPPL